MIGKSILAGLIVAAASVGSTLHAEAYLPVIGGGGGAQFMQPCPSGQNLTGFELRVGDDVDAIRPLCVISYGPSKISAPELTSGSGLVAGATIFDAATLTAGWHGGPGGGIQRLMCPASTPIVIGIDVAAEGVDHIIVNNIHVFCGLAVNDQVPAANPSAIFDAPGYTPSRGTFGLGGGRTAGVRTGTQRCPAGQVAIGVHGRYGVWLDAMGLICDAPRLTKPPLALGRVMVGGRNSKPRPPPKRVGDEPMMCARARDARARKSPTAARLEVECQASLAARAAKPINRSVEVTRTKTSASMLRAISASRPARPPSATPAPPKPVPPKPAPAPDNVFMPPTFLDGARLWACIDAAQGEAEGAACTGITAGNAYCRMQGFPDGLHAGADGAVDVVVKAVRAGTPVRAVYGDACTSNDCVVIDAMRCSP